VGFRNSVEAERRKIMSYGGYHTALTESHSHWVIHGIRGCINVRTVGDIRRLKMSVI
jgi:hypothetical protein